MSIFIFIWLVQFHRIFTYSTFIHVCKFLFHFYISTRHFLFSLYTLFHPLYFIYNICFFFLPFFSFLLSFFFSSSPKGKCNRGPMYYYCTGRFAQPLLILFFLASFVSFFSFYFAKLPLTWVILLWDYFQFLGNT